MLIKKELDNAILWIDDVVLHYDELNELKEELILLNGKIPQEGDFDAKKETNPKKN